MGDIHHYAWRCQSRNCTSYIDEHFGELYGNFTVRVRISLFGPKRT
jgi:hypothetical protein